MSQIGKKCFYASFGLHFLLVVVVIFGSAFLTTRDKPENARLVKMVDPKHLSDILKTGGGPLANAVPPTRPPAATPPPPVPEVVAHPAPKPADEPVVKPAPEPPPTVKPTPPKVEHRTPKPPEVTPVKPNPNKRLAKAPVEKVKPEPKPEPKTVKPKEKELLAEDDLTPVTRTTTQPKSKPITKPRPERHSEEIVRPAAPVTPPAPDPVELWEQRRHEAFQTAMSTIGHNSSAPITPVDIPIASGGDGGQEQTNYRDLVFSKYNAAWEPPAELEDSRVTTQVTITVAPDGRVIERRIVRPSNNRMMDRSIQATLNKVTFIEPFPAGAGAHARTYLINFNLLTKRAAG